MHIYSRSKAFISSGTLSDSPTYLGRLREAQNFWSDKCIPKIPKMYLTKPNQFVSKLFKLIIFSKYHNTSEGLNICTVPWISFLHYRKYGVFSLAGSVHIPKLHMIWEFIRYHLAHYIWNFSCVCSKILLYECMPFGLNSSPVFCQELLPHPGYYPRSSAWWHCWACPLYQSELCSHSYFNYFNGNHCNR